MFLNDLVISEYKIVPSVEVPKINTHPTFKMGWVLIIVDCPLYENSVSRESKYPHMKLLKSLGLQGALPLTPDRDRIAGIFR